MLVLDVDGVLTDGSIMYDDAGREMKTFHARDGFGIEMLQRAGVEVAILSGRKTPAVARRARELGIERCIQGSRDKVRDFKVLLGSLRLEAKAAAYVGDDVPDLKVMGLAGLAVAVADAHPSVKKAADHVTKIPGGRGAVREVADMIVSAAPRKRA